MKPIIGILGPVDDDGSINLLHTYSAAIEKAGGVPILLPFTENEETLSEYVSACDGFLFSGGVDVEPKRFGEETKSECGKIQLKRDQLEFSIFKIAFESKKAILGICRGAQVINVALGGTLYQDIPTEIKTDILHRQSEPRNMPSHSVNILADTPLMELIGKERMTANSFHHQAIKALGEGLLVMALADDAIIEAVYHNDYPYLLAYQWHPERLCDTDTDNMKIFTSFIKAASKKGETK